MNPQDCQAKGNYGYVLLTMNRASEAIRPLIEAVNCQQNDISFNLWLAQAYDITNQYEKAKEAYRKVLRLDPKNKLAKDRLAFLEFNY
ncbi:MAG: tetratricopeptide repeat protein [candidate division Zixibacteria bacterium]|nr:tetratricopeptide repeat protein [candidate division Zixibacteria bacterium]